ncbi:hypothetical protein DPM19_17800 [Actinomadura craniellae]|uniref:DUF4190 domain-containing protein n=1 Tax=Actinomadura craniellae TaxID=2231787 RepID=A0A365H5B2_9ACTN|nr:hypothetical protein DPM19_17800 [Actinomadura craniellae]
MDLVRAYTPFPFGLAGIALGVIGCVGPRRGKPLAAAGAILSVLALALGVIMIGGRALQAFSG